MYKLFQANKNNYYYFITICLNFIVLVCFTSVLGFICADLQEKVSRGDILGKP